MNTYDGYKRELVSVYPNCELGANVQIGEFTVLGKPSRLNNGKSRYSDYCLGGRSSDTYIGKGSDIGTHALIEEGVYIGDNCIIESHVIIEAGAKLKSDIVVVAATKILGGAEIGKRSIVGGVVSEGTMIGNDCRVFGNLIHKQNSPHIPWDDNIEKAPQLSNNVFVGIGANIIGNVSIGKFAFICAGATVTKDIPDYSVVKGVNEVTPIKDWKGILSDSNFFRGL